MVTKVDNGSTGRPSGNVPVPDPTILTTQQLQREIASSREIVETIGSGGRSVIVARLDAMDKAITLLQGSTDKIPAQVGEAVNRLQELHEAKFNGAIEVVNEKITSLANVTTQQFKSIDDKFAEKDKAVSVGLSAQKESAAAQQDSNNTATRKMEDNFTKLLDQGRELLQEVRRNTELQINDIKSRLDKGEGRVSVSDPQVASGISELIHTVKGLSESRAESTGASSASQNQRAFFISAVGLIGAMVIAAVSVITFFNSKSASSAPQAQIERRGDQNDLLLGKLVEQNTRMIDSLQQRLNAPPR